jgi:2-polyprenyl-3-methyl-5-hydroxy-6-metoxy-1,4-benzoquinol methylase
LARCRLCGADARLAFRVGDIYRRLSDETFDYYRCSRCQSIVLSPIPTDLGRYYPADYYRLPESAEGLSPLAEEEHYKLDIVLRQRTSGRLLDIGPSAGAFAYLAKQAGFEVSAMEMDAACCRFLERVVGVRVIETDDPAQALQSEGDYDVITLWHVIEHLPSPWEVLAEAAKKLRPGGLLVIAAPNPEALQFRLFGRYWMHLDAPRHLQLIPVAEIVHRAGSHRLRPVEITTRDGGTLTCNAAGWKGSAAMWLTDHSVRAFRWKLGGALALAAAPLDRIGRLGSAYTVVLAPE